MVSYSDLAFQAAASALSDSVTNYNTTTAPGAGATLASVTLTPGVWQITAYVKVGLGAAPAAADADNARVRDNTGGVNLLTLPVIPVAGGAYAPVTFTKRFTAQTTLITQSIGAATALLVYSSGIVAQKLSDA